ncbi:MAG: hypothetical protein FWG20_04530, partial [Candidatus Cloacimonetes bacterium]|nr:hypothetical protein [Candidatus Cloacimonadota bacterium]
YTTHRQASACHPSPLERGKICVLRTNVAEGLGNPSLRIMCASHRLYPTPRQASAFPATPLDRSGEKKR